MRTRNLLPLLFCLLCFTAKAQIYSFDNVSFKALYFSDVVKLMNTTPGLLIIDARSPGEYADTSHSTTLNMGHLSGAINIPIDSIKNHLSQLEPYKNKPILVYCSHSQRSRKVSKFLADQGFTNINNFNGGMSLVNKSTDQDFALKAKVFTTNLPYKNITSEDAYKFIADKNNLVIDIRPASQFNGTDTTEANNIGRIKGAMNIQIADADKKIIELAAYKNKPILFYDMSNNDAVDVAIKFNKAGYTKVYVLFEGMNTLLPNIPSTSPMRKALFVNLPKYKAIGSREAIDLVKNNPNLFIADLRSPAEFANKANPAFLDLGHIAGAVNLNAPALYTALEGKPKDTPVLVYSQVTPNKPLGISAPEACKQLAAKGYTNVYLLNGGMGSLVWSAANVESCKDGKDILADHKGLY